jgi:uncharacterized protein
MSKTSSDLATSHRPDECVVHDGSQTVPSTLPVSPQGRIVIDDLELRIDGEGLWYYQGSVIRRKELVCLFASALTRDEAGRYWLVTPTEMGIIDVEDVPFIAVEMFVAGNQESQLISLRTNVDQIVTVDREHPLHVRRDSPAGTCVPYVVVDKGFEARLSRPVYYEMASLSVEAEIEGRRCYAVWSAGRLFALEWLDESE